MSHLKIYGQRKSLVLLNVHLQDETVLKFDYFPLRGTLKYFNGYLVNKSDIKNVEYHL